jgi:hypothetical protein
MARKQSLLEKVRCELQREGADLKGAMWSLRGNTWNLSDTRLTSAAIEAVNGVIQLAKRMVPGLETSSASEPPLPSSRQAQFGCPNYGLIRTTHTKQRGT